MFEGTGRLRSAHRRDRAAPLVSVTEAATTLGMSRQGVLKAIRAEKLPATRVGDTWALRESAVQAHARHTA
ncbi:hypothetical protein B2J88_50960 [Rhodococcus sp. SRB_17]|nr:hypothetical protein [Rhodococcus sp. SRB_17]